MAKVFANLGHLRSKWYQFSGYLFTGFENLKRGNIAPR